MKNFLITISVLCTFYLQARLTDADIQAIYDKYVKPNNTKEYSLRYVPIPLHKNNLPWRWEDKDFPRVVALLEFERFVKDNNISCQKALSLNGSNDPEWYYIKTKQIIQANYEDDPVKYDLYTLNLPEKDFDFVMVNQTLEHVYDPIRCLENIYKHMRPGGILYLNVPANTIPHNTPFHFYTGYTPTGLGAVTQAAGFVILSIGQWGNVEYMTKMHGSNYWPDYRALTQAGFNDPLYPIITWIFAAKL